MPGKRHPLEVQPRIPATLSRLEELANDLLYSWDRQVRRLFYLLDPDLWRSCGHNPKVFLKRVSQSRLDEAKEDRGFLEEYNRALSFYDTYHQTPIHPSVENLLTPGKDLVGYFCFEFGFYESFPIYSGGLGILAGDYCKAASDLGIPFVAVGLLYRQGYFSQTIDVHGNQVAHYKPVRFSDLPISPALDPERKEIYVEVELPKRTVVLRVWKAKAGHISLYLLDSDLSENSEEDRAITYQLYGGDNHNRIQQEIVLGIGGVRALNALGLQPTIWHINEGHPALLILERCRQKVSEGWDFKSALELVAAGTVFTTHTPVPAGHDMFEVEQMTHYFGEFSKTLGINMEEFLELGATPNNHGKFNMTALGIRGSRFHNGVSRIHGNVSAEMESYIWPQITPNDNPITYVTNGVHLQTFVAREWINLFDMRFSNWRRELNNADYWSCIEEIPDHRFWSLHKELKAAMLNTVYRRALFQHQRNGTSKATIERITQHINQSDSDILVLGFARRFATYKRAPLLLRDPERLAQLLNDPEHPAIIIFAGKAHPYDEPGKQLVKVIHEFSLKPEFIGKIILLEGYDLTLARTLVTGVDVWINTPIHPLEASGTSGEKAGMNGVLNLSVLDGWWAEGYNGQNGWGIAPHSTQFDSEYRDQQESNDLLDILEREVVSLYYDRNEQGYSAEWVKLCKESMKSLIPRFNAQRMVMDYIEQFYVSAKKHHAQLAENDGSSAKELAVWKAKIKEHWPNVAIRRIDQAPTEINHDESLHIEISAKLNGLIADDVVVECIVDDENNVGEQNCLHYALQAGEQNQDGETLFTLDLKPERYGLQFYRIRMYPYHPSLCHPFETGCMLWL